MSKQDLEKCENAIQQAKRYVQVGDKTQAFNAYVNAADLMIRYSEGEQGNRRREANEIAEQLMIKAKELKKEMVEKQPNVVLPVVAKQDAKKTVSQPVRKDNQSAITQDIQGFRNSGNKKENLSEERLKFVPVESPNIHFSDVAGLDTVKEIIQMKVIQPILHPELFERFSKETNGGILLYGPPGTGKTMIARAIATETNLDFFSVRCSDIVGKSFGDGERNIKALFDAARESGRAIIFFDEFESLACKRGGGSTVMNRMVPELLSQMDGFRKAEGTLIILASTNRPWDLDTAVIRPPRMTERIYVGLPDHEARLYMVKKALESLPRTEEPDYEHIAEALEGYNCADITAFVEKVKEGPIQRGLLNNSTEQYITPEDVENALANSHSSVQQSDLEAFSKWEASQR